MPGRKLRPQELAGRTRKHISRGLHLRGPVHPDLATGERNHELEHQVELPPSATAEVTRRPDDKLDEATSKFKRLRLPLNCGLITSKAPLQQGRKRALLIACTYRGAAGEAAPGEIWDELKQAHKDIDRLRSLLHCGFYIYPQVVSCIQGICPGYAFTDGDITNLSDTPKHCAELPTRKNIVSNFLNPLS